LPLLPLLLLLHAEVGHAKLLLLQQGCLLIC
jgi:hypothetical protein